MAARGDGAIVFAMDSHEDTPLAGDPGASLLLTDLYQLTMLQSYLEHGLWAVSRSIGLKVRQVYLTHDRVAALYRVERNAELRPARGVSVGFGF